MVLNEQVIYIFEKHVSDLLGQHREAYDELTFGLADGGLAALHGVLKDYYEQMELWRRATGAFSHQFNRIENLIFRIQEVLDQ